jgi:hypothetical protein
MRKEAVVGSLLVLIATCALAQPGPVLLEITTKKLPAAGLWNPYSFRFESNQGTENLSWRLVSGSLPRKVELGEQGTIEGPVIEQGSFRFSVVAIRRDGTRSRPKEFTLDVEPPLKADWQRKSQVNGNRIDGAIKVSNTTGRDFDLTFDVLAVNDVGRATAIGYQHFTLKSNTREMELPFGNTLAPGNYVVNIDVVAEEAESKMIFRWRMEAPKQTIAPVL